MNMERIYESKQRIVDYCLLECYFLPFFFLLIPVTYFIKMSFMGSTEVILCHT